MGRSKHTKTPAYRERAISIKALLLADNLSFAEVARRVGVTRSRVQQIAAKNNIKAKRRRPNPRDVDVAAILAAAKTEQIKGGRLLGRFLKQCESRNLLTVCVLTGYGDHVVSTRDVLVNGKRVRVRSTAFGGPKPDTYASLRPMPEKCLEPIDIVATELPDGRWHLMRPQETPRKMTAFALAEPNGRGSTGAHGDRHDYRQYIERWEILRTT